MALDLLGRRLFWLALLLVPALGACVSTEPEPPLLYEAAGDNWRLGVSPDHLALTETVGAQTWTWSSPVPVIVPAPEGLLLDGKFVREFVIAGLVEESRMAFSLLLSPGPCADDPLAASAARLTLDGTSAREACGSGLGRLGPGASGPSALEIAALYREERARRPCPEQAHCPPPRLEPVSAVVCLPRPEGARCSFDVAPDATRRGQTYVCSGDFERGRTGWTLRRLETPCVPDTIPPPPLPDRRDIEAIETAARLEQLIADVGVIDNDSLNRAARVRVRAAACSWTGSAAVSCLYEAAPCPQGVTEQGEWCWRQTGYRLRRAGDSVVTSSGHWTLNPPSPSD